MSKKIDNVNIDGKEEGVEVDEKKDEKKVVNNNIRKVNVDNYIQNLEIMRAASFKVWFLRIMNKEYSEVHTEDEWKELYEEFLVAKA
jgi:hypothetical protein